MSGESEETPQVQGGFTRRTALLSSAAVAALLSIGGVLSPADAARAFDADVEKTLKKLTWPFAGPVTSGYGWRDLNGTQNFHEGMDFGKAEGTPIPAAGEGEATVNSFEGLIGYFLQINHSPRVVTRYHMLNKPSPIAVGSVVARGQIIGGAGKSGSSADGSHLHFGLFIDGQHKNVQEILNFNTNWPLPEEPEEEAPTMKPLMFSTPVGAGVSWWVVDVATHTYWKVDNNDQRDFLRNTGQVQYLEGAQPPQVLNAFKLV